MPRPSGLLSSRKAPCGLIRIVLPVLTQLTPIYAALKSNRLSHVLLYHAQRWLLIETKIIVNMAAVYHAKGIAKARNTNQS
mmetsp:Transcript_19711/g.55986  ORF Transcript_19711/g.55986 Transcript_19711/m.55986 type:complete len:81 (+) Transcript_19711:1474-1716(+)